MRLILGFLAALLAISGLTPTASASPPESRPIYAYDQANNKINTQTLGLMPATSLNNDVVWICGRKAAPAGATAAVGATATTSANLLDKYLPQTCRV